MQENVVWSVLEWSDNMATILHSVKENATWGVTAVSLANLSAVHLYIVIVSFNF